MNDAPSHEPSAEYRQQCPECATTTSAVANYCSRCGRPLRVNLPDSLGPGDVFTGDCVFVLVETITEQFPIPAAHSERRSWHVAGKVYGMQRLRLVDRRTELRIEWDDRRDEWQMKGSLRNVRLYPDEQDACSPADWPDAEVSLQQLAYAHLDGDIDE
jgi:hypothetical protein